MTSALLGAVSMLPSVSARADAFAVESALSLGIGGVTASDPTDRRVVLSSMLLGASLSARFGRLLIGGSADAAGELFGRDEGFLAVHGGWTVGPRSERYAILGEFGRHSYDDLGGGIFSGDRGTEATLPFVGLRVVGDFGSPDEGRGALVGLWLNARHDLGTAEVEDAGSFVGPSAGAWQVGGASLTGGVRVRLDLGAGGQ